MDLVAVLEESNPLDAALRDGPGAKTVWLFHLRETHPLPSNVLPPTQDIAS